MFEEYSLFIITTLRYLHAAEIVELIKRQPMESEEPFRPDLNSLLDSKPGCEEFVLQCMKDCWAEQPDLRPDFVQIRTRLKKMKDGKYVLSLFSLFYTQVLSYIFRRSSLESQQLITFVKRDKNLIVFSFYRIISFQVTCSAILSTS